MNKLDIQYQALLQDILDNGVTKADRTGTGTISVFGRQIRHKMSDGFPLLTTKKMAFKTMVTELLWFLRGDTNIKYLVDNGCHIWDGDAYKAYLKWFEDTSKKFKIVREPWTKEQYIEQIKLGNVDADLSELGPIYGKQWRSWGRKNVINYDLENVKSSDKVKVMDLIRDGGDYSKYDVKVTYQNNSIDQITNLINDLKTNPDSRRLMVSVWNVGELDQMVLPPCHYGFQVYTRELSRAERIENYNSKFENKIDVPFIKVNLGDAIENTIDTALTQANIPTRAISLMYNARSQDVPLGTPFNLASYGLLLTIIAREVNMIPDELISNMGDCHIYLNQIDGVKELLKREPYDLPKLKISDAINFNGSIDDFLDSCDKNSFELEDYKSHPAIKIPLSN